MQLRTLLEGLSYACPDSLELEVSDLAYHTARVGPGSVFVCLRGAAADGHAFARKAQQAGAVAIVAQDEVEPVDIPVIRVADTRQALSVLSAALFGHPARELKVVGITGTKGKTTTTAMLRSILEAAGLPTGTIGTLGVEIGGKTRLTNNTTPESYEIQKALRQMVDSGCKAAVMEASSIGLRDRRVAGIAFDVGVFTNFSEDHIGGNEHKDMQEYLACKSILFRQCRCGVANCDDAHWREVTAGCETLFTFGFSGSADLWAEKDRLLARPGCLGVEFALRGALSLPCVETPIPGRFSVYNALAAAGAALALGVEGQAVLEGLRTVRVKGRVEPVPVPGDYTLLIDYAHNAVSMENVLKTLREYHPNRLICMFGAGGNRPRLRRFEMGEVSGRLADLSVLTSDNPRDEDPNAILDDIVTGIRPAGGKYKVIPDRREAIRWCMENAEPGDLVVLAGKGHEDYQEIHGVKYPMDERVIVAEILKEKGLTP